MTATTTTTAHSKPWDFTAAIEFANALSLPKAPAAPPASCGDDAVFIVDGNALDYDYLKVNAPLKIIDTKDFVPSSSGLGNFDQVFERFGIPKTVPEIATSTTEPSASDLPKQDEYASDGATYTRTSKDLRNDVQFSDGANGSATEAGSPPEVEKPLTRTQRKKLRKKEREAQVQQQATVSESEAGHMVKPTPARAASAHHGPQTASPAKYLVPQKDTPKSASAPPGKHPIQHEPVIGSKEAIGQARNAVAKAMADLKEENTPNTPSPAPRVFPPHQNAANVQTPLSAQWSPTGTTPATAGQFGHTSTNRNTRAAINLLPGSINPMLNGTKSNMGIPSGPRAMNTPANANLPSANANANLPTPGIVIQPMIVRSEEDRNWELQNKMLRAFPADRNSLLKPMPPSIDPNGIHVFVDASNIFIGLLDHLKWARNIHPATRVMEPEIAFDVLALLMERRRPVARRVLAGSNPHVGAFDEAEAVGYECNIMEKVHKARKLTERQTYFKQLDAQRYGRSPKGPPQCNTVNLSAAAPASKGASGHGSGSGSDSETNTPQYAPKAYVEQGVDEVLHLKMMESICDAEKPGTMVLATGDAAAAEYSGGFMLMAQRALKWKWNVELVCWRRNMNKLYLNPEWTQAAGGKFKIIYLDDYAEELLAI